MLVLFERDWIVHGILFVSSMSLTSVIVSIGRGYAVLMDYRLSRLGLHNAVTLCGTPEYLAPEQVILVHDFIFFRLYLTCVCIAR